MNSINVIRKKIQKLYNTNPQIRINVTLTNPRINLKNEPVTITDIYSHIFRIEEQHTKKIHTLQYSDILIGRIEILDEK